MEKRGVGGNNLALESGVSGCFNFGGNGVMRK